MSEHMSIKGKCEFFHMPEDEEGGFAFCHYCGKVKQSLVIELHQGIVNDYIQCICPHCKKTIWVAELTNSHDEKDELMKLPRGWRTLGDNGRVIIKDNKKCHTCKKPTNHYDCDIMQYGKKREKYFCSEKCYNKYDNKGGKKIK